jgi:FixJ family two-component response regulator
VVDDDESVRESLAGLVESVGYEAALFDTAEQFLKSARRNDLACLILDLRLPGMSGEETRRVTGCDIFAPASSEKPIVAAILVISKLDFKRAATSTPAQFPECRPR